MMLISSVYVAPNTDVDFIQYMPSVIFLPISKEYLKQ